MSRTPAPGADFKAQGNQCFQNGDYAGADAFYSKAIVANPREPTYWTNRAMARLKMDLWDAVISDCNECLQVDKDSFKSYYYLAKAHLNLGNSEDATEHALKAHKLCVEQRNYKSLGEATQLVLNCKRKRWTDREKRRTRENQALENEVIELLETERNNAMREADKSDRFYGDMVAEWQQKIDMTRLVFDKARPKSDRTREVPEWAICDISFEIFVDPVVTKNGKSYERASIMEHLRKQEADGKEQTDPITRNPLKPADLYPNLNLREACEKFLNENGWAVDY